MSVVRAPAMWKASATRTPGERLDCTAMAARLAEAARAETSEPVPLLVVVVNYRTPDMTLECLGSLATEIRAIPGARVTVVDNGSGDGSAERIADGIARAGWRAWACVVAEKANRGFSAGNNVGLRSAPGARYFLLLNSDTLVEPGVLRYCQSLMDADPGVGAMSCLVLNDDRSIQNVARRFPTPLRRAASVLGLPWKLPRLFGWANVDDPGWDRRTTARDVDWLGGAFLFVRGDVMRTIGGLDEDFFFYGEDIEFCHRVRRAGGRCHYAPGAAIVHHGGSSSDPSRLASAERAAHAWRARHLVHEKLYGRVSAVASLAFDRLVYRLKRAYLGAARRADDPEYRRVSLVLELLARPEVLVPYRAPVRSGGAGEEAR
jgi:GT2 family glycosyltransferase